MIFSIGSQFSKEFSFEESAITIRLEDELNKYFEQKKYGHQIDKIYIGVICVSKGFEPFFVIRPPKILKNEPSIEFELKLDFKKMIKSDEQHRKRLLGSEIFETTKIIFEKKKLKGFNTKDFIKDLEYYFHNHRCS